MRAARSLCFSLMITSLILLSANSAEYQISERAGSQCAKELISLNLRTARREFGPRIVNFDIIGLLILNGIDPFEIRYQFSESPGSIVGVRGFYFNQEFGNFRIYEDAYRGGRMIVPYISRGMRGIGLGTSFYLIAVRLLWLKRNEVLTSNSAQLAPFAESLWQRLVSDGYAIKHGYKSYQMKERVAKDAATAGLLHFALKTDLYEIPSPFKHSKKFLQQVRSKFSER